MRPRWRDIFLVLRQFLTMKKILIFFFALISLTAHAQTPWGGLLGKYTSPSKDSVMTINLDALKDYVLTYAVGGGTVSTVAVATANGFAGTSDGNASAPTLTLTTSINSPVLAGNGTAISAATTTGTGSTVVLNNGPTLIAPALGTPASGTLTNATGLPISTGVSGLGTGVATFLATPSSANARTAVTDETGTGSMVFATSPTLVTPALGTPSSGVATNLTGLPLTTGVTGVLPIANGGINLSSLGADNTFLASNGTAYYAATAAFTFNDAAFSISRTSGTVNFNVPNATAALGGIVSTTTQTFAGNKTWGGTHTNTGLITGNGGIVGVSTSTLAAVNVDGVLKSSFRSVTTGVTIDENDHRTYVGTLAANITLTLPACDATRDGWEWKFVRTGADGFAFIIDPNSTETINGNTTLTVAGQFRAIDCQCINGTGWITTNL